MKITVKKEIRIRSAREWIKTYSGKNLVKGYSKKYCVDKLCAVKELRLIGVDISENYEEQLRQSMYLARQRKLSLKLQREAQLNSVGAFDSDEYFAMIIGYAGNVFPFGVTHEEMEAMNAAQEFR